MAFHQRLVAATKHGPRLGEPSALRVQTLGLVGDDNVGLVQTNERVSDLFHLYYETVKRACKYVPARKECRDSSYPWWAASGHQGQALAPRSWSSP